MKLRDYQEAAVSSIFEYFGDGATGNPIVAMPTGTGKFCDHKGVCHGKELPVRHCRSCQHSTLGDDGSWWCNVPTQPDGGGAGIQLSRAAQRKGCEHYELNSTFKG